MTVLQVLSPDDVRQIHTATLDIIESVGVRFPSPRALDIWAAHGATVDRDTSIVQVPGQLIEDALRHAPPAYTLAARDPGRDLPLDGAHVYLGTDGCGTEILDPWTGERRRSTLQDVADIARVADALDEIAFQWIPVSAQDRPPETRSLHELAAIWRNTTKHVQSESVLSEREALAAIQMAAVIAGGREALRRRPILSLLVCSISPLTQDGQAVDAALVAAEAAVPVGVLTMASCAFTGPATLAGALAVGNAEVISALALLQLAHPGAPVYYGAAQTAMDLRTGGYTGGGPADFLFGAATNALADFYDVPLSMGAFATGAKASDWQAGLENGLSSFVAAAVGSDMLVGAGLLHGSMIWSYEQLMLDLEIHGIVTTMLRGIRVDEETLALDAIRAVGPGGDFLAQAHTKRHMRELWQGRYMDRRSRDRWEADPGAMRGRALRRAQDLLRDHHPEPLDPAVDAELARIIDTSQTEAKADRPSRIG